MDAVLQTMVDERIGPGERKATFLSQFCELIGAADGVALRSYPTALKMALMGAGLQAGARVGVSVLSPSFYRVVAAELDIELVLGDIDRESGCLSQEEASRLVNEGCTALLIHEPSCQIPSGVDYRGLGVVVIEDISQSLHSSFDEVYAGSWGDLIICSFEEDGVVSTGGGAILAYRQKAFAQKVDPLFSEIRPMIELPDMNAALGVVQLATLEEQVARRAEIHTLFAKGLLKTSHRLFGNGTIDFASNGYTFTTVLDSKAEEAIKFAKKYQVEAKRTFENSFGALVSELYDDFPQATAPFLRGISFPIYPFLKQSDVELLLKVISHLP
jgi:perosamine synthetase